MIDRRFCHSQMGCETAAERYRLAQAAKLIRMNEGLI
jgi:hypothetical protein